MRELIQAEQALGNYTRKHARHIISGELGNNAGTVDHPTRTNFVYVKLHGDDNQVVEAEAVASFPHQAGIIVAVELVKRNAASRYQVLGLASNILFVNSTWAGTVGGHAAQHQRRDLGQGGFDPLDIYNRALVNLRGRAQATPDLTVYVERGFYFIGGALYEWTGGNSAAFAVPAGSFGVTVRRCDLLYIGSDQALHIVQGATTSDGSVPAYPTTPYPCIPIAYVYLTSSSTSIGESNIKDARVILTASDGTPVAHNLLSATHGDTLTASVVAGDIIIGNDTPKWSRLAITVPAANVRNVVGVDNGETKPSWKVALDATTPADIAGTAAAGTSLVFPHRDHVHRGVLSINKAADTTLYGAVTLSEGANITLTQVGQDISIAAAAGGGAHTILSATHTDTLADTVVDGDVLIGNATPKWSRLAISAPAANVRNVLGVDNTETRPSWKTALDSTNPANAVLTASPGTSLVFSHRDHVHAIDQTITPTWTGLHKFQQSNIQTTYTDAVQLINNTAATAGVTVQQSPSEHFISHVWKTGYGDLTTEVQVALVPASGAGPVTTLHWQFEDSQVLTWYDIMTLDDSGNLRATGAITSPVRIIAQSGTCDGIDLGIVGYGASSYRVSLQVNPLTASRTVDFNDVSGSVALGAGTATVSSANSNTIANHTHAITSSSNPGAAAAILASDASGYLTLVKLTTTADIHPDSDGRGLMARVVNRLGLTVYTDHFRSGSIPTNFTWQGAPFGTPNTITYNSSGDYLYTYITSGTQRAFLSKAITNSGAAWQNKRITGRCRAGVQNYSGVRIDDGSDNNYAELYMYANNNGTQTVHYKTRAGGGAASDTATSLTIPVTDYVVLDLYVNYANPNYTAEFYVFGEEGAGALLGSASITAWAPAAGRAGIIATQATTYDIALCDWLYDAFG